MINKSLESGAMVSIVVPAFNVKGYVKKCIDSLLEQTYQQIEIILIDDGSTDGTGELIDSLYGNFGKVKIYHKENGGLSDARNYGLDRINGAYITFVDSDDFVDKHYISHLMEMVISEDADISIVGTQIFYDEKLVNRDFKYEFTRISTDEAVRKMLVRDNIAHTACGKLYKSQIWRDLRFPVGLLYEDYHTTFDAFSKSKVVCVSSDKLYFYFQRPESIMHYSCNARTASIIDATKVVTPRIIKYWPDLETEAKGLQCALCMKCLQSIYESGNKDLNTYEQTAKAIIRSNAITLITSGRIGRNDKVKMLLLLINKNLFSLIYRIFDGNRRVS